MRALVVSLAWWLCPTLVAAQCLAAHGDVIAEDCAALRLSRDDGHTFVDTGLAVAAVTVTDDDRVMAATDDQPPSLFEVGGSARQTLPLERVSGLGAVGRSVIVAGEVSGQDWTLSVLVADTNGLRELGRVPLRSRAIEMSVTGTERDPHVEVVTFVGLSCWAPSR